MWLFLVLFILILVYLERFLQCKKFQIIPGPKGIFMLHNALDFMVDPVKMFYYFRGLTSTYKRLFKLQLGPLKVLIIHNPEDIENVINGTKCNSKGFVYNFIKPWLKEGLVTSQGQKWHMRRKMITPAFHFNILNNFKIIIEQNARTLASQFSYEINKSKTEILPLLQKFTLNTICETAMGIKLEEDSSSFANNYKESIHKIAQYAVYRAQRIWMYPNLIYNLTYRGRKQNKFVHCISSFRAQVVEKRRECGVIQDTQQVDDDPDQNSSQIEKKKLLLLDILFQAEKKGMIDIDGIGEEVDTFLFAGHDTTSIGLNFFFMLLANHPDVQEKIIEELDTIFESPDSCVKMEDLSRMKYLECCIKESLRLYPPIPVITRNIDQPLKLKDYEIPHGTECGILIYDLHRRSDQFIEPLEFKPERFQVAPTWHPYGYIPFSAGPRNCIGQKFAMMEMKLAVSTVLRRVRVLPVTTPRDVILTTDYVLRTKQPIYVKFVERFIEN